MSRRARGSVCGLILWLLPWVAAAQTNPGSGVMVDVTPDGGVVVIDQPVGAPTLTCPSQCTTISDVSNQPGSTFTFTINPAPGWVLASWVVDGNIAPPTNSVQLGPFSGQVSGTVQANLNKLLTVNVIGAGQGLVSSNDQLINCSSGQVCQQAYSPDQSNPVVLTATASAGSEFIGWNQSGGANACMVATDPSCVVDPSRIGFGGLPNELTATFELLDGDGDGVPDNTDQCPNTPPNTPVDAQGCPLPQDSDGDGVTDGVDQCPNTPPNTPVDSDGCPIPQDSDGDGVNDGVDQCPNTPPNTPVGSDGCPISQDSDGDGVTDGVDQCPNTPPNTAVDTDGCPLPQDSDGDGVTDGVDQCPNTPSNTPVDAQGCPLSQDADGDGVIDGADQCPGTPLGTAVDSSGCPLPPPDEDDDGVPDEDDACPGTPAGEVVDGSGCSASQKDSDNDGVNDANDSCPQTPAGEAVDANGCSDSQKDTDDDGVSDAVDICPQTPAGEAVDANGCGDSQKDTDGDGVNDAQDSCPGTPIGEPVDGSGCGLSQLDSDGDGISDAADQCPNTVSGDAVVDSGCTAAEQEIRDFGPDLVELDGLNPSQRSVAGVIDAVCPDLIAADESGELRPQQRQLREQCSALKNTDTPEQQQLAALEAITPDDIATRTDLALEVGRTQLRLTQTRVNRIRTGFGGGFSASDLTVSLAGTEVPVAMLEQAAEAGGGGAPAFSDFGNWGFFLQGDIELGDRDDESGVAGYDFDYWLLSAGTDYRFGATGYLGASLNFGGSDTSSQFSSTDGDIWGATVYGGFNLGEGGFIDGMVAWLEQDYSIVRTVEYGDSSGSFGARHLADTQGSHYSAGLNAGYMFNRGGWRLGPTASVLYIDGQIDGYAERAAAGDSAAWTMAYGDNNYGLTAFALGLQADYAWLTDWGVLMPGFRFTLNSDDETTDLRLPLRFVNDPFATSSPVTLTRAARDDVYWESAFSLAGQFSYGLSAYMSVRVVGARSGYRQSGYTVGLRWDRVF